MEFTDVTDLVRTTEFKVFRSVIDNGGMVKGIVVPGDAGIPRRELDGPRKLCWSIRCERSCLGMLQRRRHYQIPDYEILG